MLEQYIPYFATFIVALIVALDSAAFSMLLRHSLGFPQNSTPDPKGILFGWTYKMACIALEKHDPTLLSQLKKLPISEARKRSQIAAAAREHYGFQNALGMCIICTNFWVSLAFSLGFYAVIWANVPSPLSYLLLVPYLVTSISFSYLLLYKQVTNG